MRKIVIETGWVPKELDVYVDVDDVIDISHMRSKGLQSGEELLHEEVIAEYVVLPCSSWRPGRASAASAK
ncbi:hypothetical protein Tco_1015318 [Tanacetum coccineum]|uniref:Uncharacterized protein n=1 Tax=Tanacetum coccineum TaxID=301880 RepID=A0ABQ5FKG6_9ASTR